MLESQRPQVIVIEKIIVVQSRDFLEVNSLPLPREMQQECMVKFFLDSQLFQLRVEQPIVIVCHAKDSPKTRIIEQHHFMVFI